MQSETVAVSLTAVRPERVRLIESLAVASVDHGVTPPSAQATVLAATVRAPLAMALASGAGAITDVHGGAGQEAARFFLSCVDRGNEAGLPPVDTRDLEAHFLAGGNVLRVIAALISAHRANLKKLVAGRTRELEQARLAVERTRILPDFLPDYVVYDRTTTASRPPGNST